MKSVDTATGGGDGPSVLERVHAALERDTRIGAARSAITLAFAGGVLTVGGEVASVAVKRRALKRAAAEPGVHWVIDRLCVEQPVRTEDGALRDHLRNVLLGDTAFLECRIVVRSGVVTQVARDPEAPRGLIDLYVDDGVVTLDGDVPSGSHRRLAGVYAWWSSGTRNVHNRLGVTPPEVDNDGEITDAVRLALEKDPLVNASQLGVRTDSARVTLTGTVRTDVEKELAERDAWYVLGVDDVQNQIGLHA